MPNIDIEVDADVRSIGSLKVIVLPRKNDGPFWVVS